MSDRNFMWFHEQVINTYLSAVVDEDIKSLICGYNERVQALALIIYDYTGISDESISTDDEIINWTFPEVIHDLECSNFNLVCGYYKCAAMLLRNSLEIAISALYFQIYENENTETGQYNEHFLKWDRGKGDTPNWRLLKEKLKAHNSFIEFKKLNGFDYIEKVYDHFKHLCNYTHSRPFNPKTNEATNNMNMTGCHNYVDKVMFKRIYKLGIDTIGWILGLWIVAFPQMLSGNFEEKSRTITYREIINSVDDNQAINFAVSQNKKAI